MLEGRLRGVGGFGEGEFTLLELFVAARLMGERGGSANGVGCDELLCVLGALVGLGAVDDVLL
jgi:hypothetical protein